MIAMAPAPERTVHCYDCGAACATAGAVPVCADHGPRWMLVRNAPGAAVVITDERGVLLGRRAREPWRGCWEVPGGFVDLGEHPADTARREAREELGVTVTLTALLGVYVFRNPDGQWIQSTDYLGETADEAVPDGGEVLECRWFAPADLPGPMAGPVERRIEDWRAGRARPLPGS